LLTLLAWRLAIDNKQKRKVWSQSGVALRQENEDPMRIGL